jgi:hypothetical protein
LRCQNGHGPEGIFRSLGNHVESPNGYPDLDIHYRACRGTVKGGSNLPIHGVIGKFGIDRFANMLGLLDQHIRKVKPERAKVGGLTPGLLSVVEGPAVRERAVTQR